jgi:hypothetical protein
MSSTFLLGTTLNVGEAVVDRLMEAPVYLGFVPGLSRGNEMHWEMSVDQMFAVRPTLATSTYGGPIQALHLTGPGAARVEASWEQPVETLLNIRERNREIHEER